MSDFPAASEHSDPVEVFPDVWVIRGSLVGEHQSITRNMVVIRDGGELTLVNSVRLTGAGEARLADLGKVTHLVKLGAFHGLDDPYYRSRYPVRFWAPPGSTHKGGITHDRELTEDSMPPLPGLSVFRFRNTRLPEAVLRLPAGGGTLITCDAVTNVIDLEGTRGMERIYSRENGFLRPASIGLFWRNGMAREDGSSLFQDFQRLLDLEFRNLISGHGPPLVDTAREDLRESVRVAFGVRRWPARVQ